MVTTVETWDINPELPVELALERLDFVTPLEAGIVQRADVQQSVSVNTDEPEAQVFTLRWQYATWDNWDRFLAIWRTTARGVFPISFTPPDGSALPVYIVGEPSAQLTGPTSLSMTVKLREAINS